MASIFIIYKLTLDSFLQEPVADIPHAHDSHVFSLAWHPLGHMLCSGSNDQHAKFWTRQHPGDGESANYQGAPNRHSYNTMLGMNETNIETQAQATHLLSLSHTQSKSNYFAYW